MSTPYDSLEERLRALRPTRLPGATRREIVREIRPPGSHHAFWSVALAAALTLAMGWQWLVLSGHHYRATSAAASQAGTQSFLAAVSPISANAVAVLRSPLLMTNTQFRR